MPGKRGNPNFVKGHKAGNLQGRPKKGFTLTDLLNKELDKKNIEISSGPDKGKKITAREALAAKAVNLAIGGDRDMIRFIYRQIDGDPNPQGNSEESPLRIDMGGPEIFDESQENVEVFRGDA
jgi:hypothetical protein